MPPPVPPSCRRWRKAMPYNLTDEQLRAILDGTADEWPNVGQTRAALTELLALRAAWKIAEPHLPSRIYARALEAMKG